MCNMTDLAQVLTAAGTIGLAAGTFLTLRFYRVQARRQHDPVLIIAAPNIGAVDVVNGGNGPAHDITASFSAGGRAEAREWNIPCPLFPEQFIRVHVDLSTYGGFNTGLGMQSKLELTYRTADGRTLSVSARLSDLYGRFDDVEQATYEQQGSPRSQITIR